MKLITKISLILLAIIIALLAWAPWVTDGFATNAVVEHLGGPDAKFFYLDEEMFVKEIPKNVRWFPFGKTVVFPSEAAWVVTFYGDVL